MTQNEKNIIEYLRCIKCSGELTVKDHSHLRCKSCFNLYEFHDNVVKMMPTLSQEMKYLVNKWDGYYKNELKSKEFVKEYTIFVDRYLEKTRKQLFSAKKINRNTVYLEIGSGYFFIGQNMASDCKLVIGVEICPTAIKISKKMLEEKKIRNYLLVEGDILHMPIKDDKVDLIYGGGVIEHFEETQDCIREVFRVLKKGGVSFNTVPYLNIGSLTYRQLWGNIPNMPLLRQLAMIFHTKILRGGHMRYGFELSFLSSTLKSIHKKAGFKEVKVEKFDVSAYFEFLPRAIRKPFIYLANNSRLFWPMVKVVAVK